jgi:hypothetical protein
MHHHPPLMPLVPFSATVDPKVNYFDRVMTIPQVVATIHQPNSEITEIFDDLTLLAKGRVLYTGAYRGAPQHFSAAGHPCPLYMNPTDFYIRLSSKDDIADDLAARWAAVTAKGKDVSGKALDADEDASMLALSLEGAERGGRDAKGARDAARGGLARASSLGAAVGGGAAGAGWCGGGAGRAPAWYQIWVLMIRFFRSWWRTPVLIAAETIQYVFLAIFSGLVYLFVGRVGAGQLPWTSLRPFCQGPHAVAAGTATTQPVKASSATWRPRHDNCAPCTYSRPRACAASPFHALNQPGHGP